MDKKKTMLLSSHLWLLAAVIVMAGLMAFSLNSVQAKQGEKAAGEPNKAAMMKEKMRNCTASCVKSCHASMEDISAAKTAIKAAIEAIDKGESALAKSELEKAEMFLTKAHNCMKGNIEKMPCANSKCPISGKLIDKMNRPQDCTVMYKDMKVGFCCPNCPPEWNKLTDAEKDAKLKEAMPSKE